MHLTAEHPQLHLPACVQGSCGIQVAAYAGLPPSLLQRASQQASRLALSQTQAQAQPIHALNSHTAVEAAAAQPRGCHSSNCVGAGSTGGSSVTSRRGPESARASRLPRLNAPLLLLVASDLRVWQRGW